MKELNRYVEKGNIKSFSQRTAIQNAYIMVVDPKQYTYERIRTLLPESESN